MQIVANPVKDCHFCAPLLALHAQKPVLDTPGGGPRVHLIQYVGLAAVSAQDGHSHAMAPALLPLHPLLDAAHRMHEREGVSCHDLQVLQGPHMDAVRLRAAAIPQLLDRKQFDACMASLDLPCQGQAPALQQSNTHTRLGRFLSEESLRQSSGCTCMTSDMGVIGCAAHPVQGTTHAEPVDDTPSTCHPGHKPEAAQPPYHKEDLRAAGTPS